MKKLVMSILFLSTCFGCARVPLSERHEGLINGKIRIYVRMDTYDIPETMTDLELDAKLSEIASERYSDLLNEFVSLYTFLGKLSCITISLNTLIP